MSLLNRELSWLQFNERVLQEAMDLNVPLVERMRFLGIYSNNMDEFYRVRVASIKRAIEIGVKNLDGFIGNPARLLDEIKHTIVVLQKKFEDTYSNVCYDLQRENVFQVNESNLTEEQTIYLENYYHNQLRQNITPILIKPNASFPRLKDKGIYLAVKIVHGLQSRYAIIDIPSNQTRIHVLPKDGEKDCFILIDDIIRLNLKSIFSIFEIDEISAYTFKFSRDAELNLEEDLHLDVRERMEKSLKNRKKGIPVRFVYDIDMPADMYGILLKGLTIKSNADSLAGGRYHNFKDFMKFPSFGKPHLLYDKFQALVYKPFEKRSVFKAILKKDHLLHFPYQRFDYLVDLLREAALDPKIKAIKINIYRVAHESKIMNALINAVRNGKEVTAVIELQARFDEENNLYWAERLQEEGAKVIHGIDSLKIHSKLLYILKQNGTKKEEITFVGTGNFHEGTANIYSDLGFFTANKTIVDDVKRVFRYIENPLSTQTNFAKCLVSPFNNRREITKLIDFEIAQAKRKKKAKIQLKLNNLVDAILINKLIEASSFGVQIDLIVRGICCLQPEPKGKTKNIKITSIVDRFLEHSRFLIFHNAGKPKYFITSADWMERNMDRRIEVGVPILDIDLQRKISDFFNFQKEDNFKGRQIGLEVTNRYPEIIRNLKTRSQQLTYDYLRSEEFES